MMYLNALGCAPFSSWYLDRMNAVTMITAILANSEGWNCIPKNVIHLAAPFTRSPVIIPIPITKSSKMHDNGNKKKGNTLKYLHGMLCTTTTINAPTIKMTLCWVIGPQWSPLL